MSFVSCVRRTLRERRLVAPGMRVLVACSGGPDSSAMLIALTQLAPELGLQLEVASVDHGLRADAQADVDIARAQAAALGVQFHALRAEVGSGSSLQARAREARYRVLLELAAARGMQRVATGHTLEDQAETVLLRLLRGAGVRGLSAIEPLRADGVMRPILDTTRQDAHAFARAHAPAIAWDRSNDDMRFERTRARHELLPALRGVDPALDRHLAHLADEARELTGFVDDAANLALSGARVDEETLMISALEALPVPVREAALRMFLASVESPISGAHLRQLVDACASGHGEIWLSAVHAVVVEPTGRLRVMRRDRTGSDPTA